jgi:hypothetical protein
MPISADRFEEMPVEGDDGPAPGTNADAILSFLRANPDRAFTQSEIAEATDVKRGSVGPTLVRLRDRGRVDHRGRYWRVSDHDESVGAATGLSAEAAAARETDDEVPDYDTWQAHAVDPREMDE